MPYKPITALVLMFLISCTPAPDQVQENTPNPVPSISVTATIQEQANTHIPTPSITNPPSESVIQVKNLQPIMEKGTLWIDAIAADNVHAIWLVAIGDATDNKYSLIKYDEKDWLIYEIPINMVSCYANAPLRVSNLDVDANGIVWANSGCKIFRFDGNTWKAYSSSDGIGNGEISTLVIDHAEDIWVGTDKGFISKFDKKKWITYSKNDSTNLDAIYSIIALPDGTLWFGGQGGISHFDGNQWATYKHQDKNNQPIEAEEIAATKDGGIWILEKAKEGPIYYFDGNDWKDMSGIENRIRTSIFVEQNGHVWVGAIQRLFYFTGEAWLEIPSPTVSSMTQTQDGTIWIGTFSGLYRYNPNK